MSDGVAHAPGGIWKTLNIYFNYNKIKLTINLLCNFIYVYIVEVLIS